MVGGTPSQGVTQPGLDDGGYPEYLPGLGLDCGGTWLTPPTSRPGRGTPHPEMGYPPPSRHDQGTPLHPGIRYPPTCNGISHPPPPPPPPSRHDRDTPPSRQSSIASTCYAAGGMPLAFTQEDFLIIIKINVSFRHITVCQNMVHVEYGVLHQNT